MLNRIIQFHKVLEEIKCLKIRNQSKRLKMVKCKMPEKRGNRQRRRGTTISQTKDRPTLSQYDYVFKLFSLRFMILIKTEENRKSKQKIKLIN